MTTIASTPPTVRIDRPVAKQPVLETARARQTKQVSEVARQTRVADSPPKATILPSEAELAVNDVGKSKIAVETKLRPKATQAKPEVKQATAEVVPEAKVKDTQPKIEPNQERSLGKPVPRAIGSVVNLIV